MTQKALVELRRKRFYAGNAAGIVERNDAGAHNHQATQAPVHGRDAIRAMVGRAFSATRCRDKLSFLKRHGLPIE